MKYTIKWQDTPIGEICVPDVTVIVGIDDAWKVHGDINMHYFTKLGAMLDFINSEQSRKYGAPMCSIELINDSNACGKYNVVRNLIRMRKLRYFDHFGNTVSIIQKILSGDNYVPLEHLSLKQESPVEKTPVAQKNELTETTSACDDKIHTDEQKMTHARVSRNKTNTLVSIVMAYKNRRELLKSTLYSIRLSQHKNVEVIIVDDCSNAEHKIKDFETEFKDLRVRVVEMPADKHWYINPCVPYNVGFGLATGDIVIIQNPECLHYDDIIKYTIDNLGDYDYFSFECYPANDDDTSELVSVNAHDYDDYKKTRVTQAMLDTNFSNYPNGTPAWYTHAKYNDHGYHFAAAIKRKQLVEIGGFDEKFAHGMAFDDDAFVYHVKMRGLDFSIISECRVIHLEHPKYAYDIRLWTNNKKLFDNLESSVPVSGENNIWLYWETPAGNRMPRYIAKCRDTVYMHCGKDFKVRVVTPHNIKYYLPKINQKYLNFKKIAHRADYIRYQLLNTYGGIWLDSDYIVFKSFKPVMETIRKNGFIYSGYIHNNEIIPMNTVIGAMPKNALLTYVINDIHGRYFETQQTEYEIQWDAIGSDLIKRALRRYPGHYYKTESFYPVHFFNGDVCNFFGNDECVPEYVSAFGQALNNNVFGDKFESDFEGNNLLGRMFNYALGISNKIEKKTVSLFGKIPKNVFLYWDGSPMSYMQYLTAYTLSVLNPEYDIYVVMPQRSNYAANKPWQTFEQKQPYLGRDFFGDLLNLHNVSIIKYDLSKIGISAETPEIHKSDIIRLMLLYEFGGTWSDFDIFYFRPLHEINMKCANADTGVHIGKKTSKSNTDDNEAGHHMIGFMFSSKGNKYYGDLYNSAKNFLCDEYQCVGATMLEHKYPTVDSIRAAHPNLTVENFDEKTVYPVRWSETEQELLFKTHYNRSEKILMPNTIGIHWYNGHPIARKFQNEIRSLGDLLKTNNIFAMLYKKYFNK